MGQAGRARSAVHVRDVGRVAAAADTGKQLPAADRDIDNRELRHNQMFKYVVVKVTPRVKEEGIGCNDGVRTPDAMN